MAYSRVESDGIDAVFVLLASISNLRRRATKRIFLLRHFYFVRPGNDDDLLSRLTSVGVSDSWSGSLIDCLRLIITLRLS